MKAKDCTYAETKRPLAILALLLPHLANLPDVLWLDYQANEVALVMDHCPSDAADALSEVSSVNLRGIEREPRRRMYLQLVHLPSGLWTTCMP